MGKPSFLKTMNTIATGEKRGYELLDAWAKATTNPEVGRLLNIVAIREGEHAAAFEKRICELGYGVKNKGDNADFGKTLDLVKSDASDVKKFETLGFHKAPAKDAPDQLLQILADQSIDAQTAALMGRFIAEERDSGRLLRQAYECAQGGEQSHAGGADLKQTVDDLCAQVAQLSTAVAGLMDSKRGKAA